MASDQPLPNLWLLSDERNDARLEMALATLPKGNAFVFRHYHLKEKQRRARFDELVGLCRLGGHLVVLASDTETAAAWGADGAYGQARKLGRHPGMLRFAAVHDVLEVNRANRMEVDAMFLSPVFATRSHPGSSGMGSENFRIIASYANCPVIALGGMDAARAAALDWPRWAAIDGLS